LLVDEWEVLTIIIVKIFPEKAEVLILAVGIKIRERIFIGGKEVNL